MSENCAMGKRLLHQQHCSHDTVCCGQWNEGLYRLERKGIGLLWHLLLLLLENQLGMKPEVLSNLPGLKWKCDDKLCLESVLHCAEHNKDVIPTTGGQLFTASCVCWLTAGSTPLQSHIMCALLHLGVLLACFFCIYTHVCTHARAHIQTRLYNTLTHYLADTEYFIHPIMG